jgi:hypothetical protein
MDYGNPISRIWELPSHENEKWYLTDVEKNVSHEYGKCPTEVEGGVVTHGYGKTILVVNPWCVDSRKVVGCISQIWNRARGACGFFGVLGFVECDWADLESYEWLLV